MSFAFRFTRIAPLALLLGLAIAAPVHAAPADEAQADAPDEVEGSACTCDCPCAEASAEEGTSAPSQLPADEDPAVTRARETYERGLADYAASRYEEAVTAWLEAFEQLPANYETGRIRGELIYNVATAQNKAYDIDREIEHLRQARQSLREFASQIDDIYPEGAERDRERAYVEGLLSSLDERISLAEEMEAERERELARLSRPDFDPELDAEQRKRNRSLIVSGSVLGSFGVLGLGLMGGGFALGAQADAQLSSLESASELEERRDLITQGQRGNAMAVAGGLFGGLSAITGLTLLSVGLSREKKRRAYQRERSESVSIVPWGGRSRAGLSLSGRF